MPRLTRRRATGKSHYVYLVLVVHDLKTKLTTKKPSRRQVPSEHHKSMPITLTTRANSIPHSVLHADETTTVPPRLLICPACMKSTEAKRGEAVRQGNQRLEPWQCSHCKKTLWFMPAPEKPNGKNT